MSGYPEYPIEELLGDLHHLLQPLIGFRRLSEQDSPTERGQYEIERLLLALGLVNIAAGIAPWKDVDVRTLRARHGCGAFETERADLPAKTSSVEAHDD